MFFKKYWKSILGVAFWLGPIWDFIKWCLDWRGRVDTLAATYHDIGGYHVIIAYLLNPPSWLYLPFMIAGLVLIWWNVQRPKKTNLKALARNGDIPPGTVVLLDGCCDFKIDGKNFECEGKDAQCAVSTSSQLSRVKTIGAMLPILPIAVISSPSFRIARRSTQGLLKYK
jgi:hypothetical protein